MDHLLFEQFLGRENQKQLWDVSPQYGKAEGWQLEVYI